MRVRTPPPTRACEVCFTPVLVSHRPPPAAARCDRHVDVVRSVPPAHAALPARALPTLRQCPACGGQTFREAGVCSTCDPEVPPLRGERVANSRAPRRRMRSNGSNGSATRAVRTAESADRTAQTRTKRRPSTARHGRVVPELARAIAELPAPPVAVSGLKLEPDAPGRRGNRCHAGRAVTAQRPAMDKALRLREVPGEWEVLAFYSRPDRVKAAVWYLRHVVAAQLPPGRWRFARCPWERAAVMGRYDAPG